MSALACTQCHEHEEEISTPHSPFEESRFVQQVGCTSFAAHPYSRIGVDDG